MFWGCSGPEGAATTPIIPLMGDVGETWPAPLNLRSPSFNMEARAGWPICPPPVSGLRSVPCVLGGSLNPAPHPPGSVSPAEPPGE